MQETNQPEPNPPVNVEKPPKRGHILFIATIALIIALISLALQFFLWQLHKKSEETLINQDQQLIASIQPKFQKLSSDLLAQQKTLDTLVARDQGEDKKNNLMLAQEAKHLLTLANYSLAFENNIELASKLLLAADQKLEPINDAGIILLRKSLMSNLTALNATPKVDVGALVSRISAISDQVAELSALPVMPTTVTEKKSKATVNLSWKEKLMETFRSLREIVTIRRLPEPVKPLASPEQQIYTVENIRLKLSQAQWAVLHQNPEVYQNSLEQAKKQLQAFYFRNPKGASLVQMLNELQQINIKPNVPDLGNTIGLLQSYINRTEQVMNTVIKPTPSSPAPVINNAPTATALPS